MSEDTQSDLPSVSVLIAARNEEHTILDCLRAIDQLDYPRDRLQVLIGNDASTDRTANVVSEFITNKPAYQLVSITETRPNLNGKANVLAQLARLATGDVLVTTDADARIPSTWLRGLVLQFMEPGRPVGVANGCTIILGDSVWARVQAVECVLVFRLLSLAADLHIPLTGVGNNMAISREAYEAVGGFESQPFSVVEDYTLFQAIVRRGYGFRQKLTPDTLVRMLPPPTLPAYLQQRKRWMQGVFDLPLPLLLTTLVQYLLSPLLLVLAFWWPTLALSLYAARMLTQTLLLWGALNRLRLQHLWGYALLYEPYQALFGLLAFVYYWLPVRIVWKERAY